MADMRVALQKLSRGQALTDEEAALVGYTQPTTPVATTPVSTRTGLSASDYGPGGIPIQAQNTGDIVSDRYTAMAKAAGLTPTPVGATGPINIPVFESGVKEVSRKDNGDGTFTVTYSDGTTKIVGTKTPTGKTVTSVTYEGTGKNRIKITKYSDGTETREAAPDEAGGQKTIVSTYTDPTTGDVIAVYSDGSTGVLSKGTKIADAAKAKADADALAKAGRQSAYDLLFQQFDAYGLGALVTPLRGLIESGINPAEFTLKLRETDAYKKRFAANAQRINKGLRALSEAEYIGLEDQYQDVMRRYGLPDTYYTRGEMGRQEGFEKFIGGDVSPVELEDRIQTAQRRVLNAAPQIKDALTQYYGNEISNGDILAYVLDPEKAIENIKRKVTAAEIGGAASIAGLSASRARAEELGAFGVTGERARQGYTAISEFLPQARVLGERYAREGLGAYDQATAEAEVFSTAGSAEAGRKRRKLAELETAQFSGQTGVTGGALGRERAGQF
jgi:hypothetical protein